jgi:hypothetical protein
MGDADQFDADAKGPRMQTKITVVLTDDLIKAIDSARGDKYRSESVERWLWRAADMRYANVSTTC